MYAITIFPSSPTQAELPARLVPFLIALTDFLATSKHLCVVSSFERVPSVRTFFASNFASCSSITACVIIPALTWRAKAPFICARENFFCVVFLFVGTALLGLDVRVFFCVDMMSPFRFLRESKVATRETWKRCALLFNPFSKSHY
jgi:hypothetical protein